MIKCSIESAKRFIELFLGINATPYWFHQTLTFKDNLTDPKIAKGALKQLLDSLEKAFPDSSCFFVQQYQKRQGIHFHVIFMVFGDQQESPDGVRDWLSKEVFARWNTINGESLNRKGNEMKLREKNFICLRYLTREVSPTTDPLARESHWWGIRNKKLIRANSAGVSKETIKKMYNELFPKPPKPAPQAQPLPKVFTKQDLMRLKDYIDFQGSWEHFKKQELKTHKKVSNTDYLNFRNQERNKILAKRLPKEDPSDIWL
jgi:hypothetical protein